MSSPGTSQPGRVQPGLGQRTAHQRPVQSQRKRGHLAGRLAGPLPGAGVALPQGGRHHLLDERRLPFHRGPDRAQVAACTPYLPSATMIRAASSASGPYRRPDARTSPKSSSSVR